MKEIVSEIIQYLSDVRVYALEQSNASWDWLQNDVLTTQETIREILSQLPYDLATQAIFGKLVSLLNSGPSEKINVGVVDWIDRMLTEARAIEAKLLSAETQGIMEEISAPAPAQELQKAISETADKFTAPPKQSKTKVVLAVAGVAAALVTAFAAYKFVFSKEYAGEER